MVGNNFLMQFQCDMLGVRVDTLAGDTSGGQSTGWDEAERSALQATIAALRAEVD